MFPDESEDSFYISIISFLGYYLNMKKNFKYLFFLLLLTIINLQAPQLLFAQGEGYSQYKLFLQETIDDYFVTISISPKNPVAGQQIFSINVVDAKTKMPSENLKIQVYATPLFESNKKKSPALSSSDMQGYYQSILRLEKEGNWVMDFEIDNGKKITIISEQIEIFERNRTLGSGSISYGFVFLQIIFLFGVVFVFISARRKRKNLSK